MEEIKHLIDGGGGGGGMISEENENEMGEDRNNLPVNRKSNPISCAVCICVRVCTCADARAAGRTRLIIVLSA